ncbi:MAG: PAS domain S-box protein [Anaerolineales bacterium]|nr:PAS domain S-box protein [Anaerolineales bacterium]
MRHWLAQLFFPPLFEGVEVNRAGHLLKFVFRFTLGVIGIAIPLNLLIIPTSGRILPLVLVGGIVLALYRLIGLGKIKLAAILYISLTTLVVLILAYLSGGLLSPVFNMLLVSCFFAGVLLGGRGGLIFVGIALGAAFGFLMLHLNNPPPSLIHYLPVDYLVVFSVLLMSIMVLLFTVLRSLRDALEQAQQEITERRQTAASFKKLEQRYQSIFNRTNDAVILMSVDSTIIDVNERGAEMFGISRTQMIGRRGLEFVAPGERDTGMAQLQNVVGGQTLPIYERKMVRANGQEFPVEINLSLVYDEQGLPIQTQSVVRDISERKKTEEKLINIENRYNALFEAHTDGIFLVGLNGRILESNQRAAKMLGFSLDEILGQDVGTFVAIEDRPNLQERILTLQKGQPVPLYERKFICKDGRVLPTEVNAMMVYDKDGQPQGIQSIVRDISERKKNEGELHFLIHQLENQRAKIETALEVSKATISILEPDILIQKIVDLVQERFGYYYVGLFLLSEDHTHAVLRAGTGEAGQKMLASQHALLVGAGSMVGWSIANKTPRIALDVGLDAVHFDNPLLPETRSEMALPLMIRGEAIGALTVQSAVEAAFSQEDIAVLQVVTDLVAIAIQNARFHTQLTGYAEELERRVLERTAQLEATNQELESFSYSVSHDLRTPLRAINGYSSILLDEFASEFSPPARSFQEKIRHNATRMGELVDGLLAFSRLGRKKIQKTEVTPSLLVAELIEQLETEITRRGILLTLEDLPPCEADPLLLKQVYANLLSNAIKFTRDQPEPRITIGTRPTETGLAYFVRDNGAGFDMQYVDRLFRVFQRLHREDEFEGTGVGLAIIQRIIHRHGGNVWAEAELGHGATFFFTLGGMAIDDTGIFF